MQVLYQIDATGETGGEAILEGLDAEHDAEEVRRDAVELALAAWGVRADADAQVAALAPDWPTHRQPPVDRAILRLAYHEMVSGRSPMKVAINEAVELAKQYSNEHAPAFINGVLDKLHKSLPPPGVAPPPEAPKQKPSAEAWLDDAV